MIMCKCNKKFCSRFIPNFLIISLISAITFSFLLFVLPELINKSNSRAKYYFNFIFTMAMYIMWLWCWVITIAGDPGRTADDLRNRGLLKRIENGDIPDSLRKIPLCPECNLPRPRRAYHCDECGSCHLRFDHHCVITGQCVADKNFKAFILSFLYASMLEFSVIISSAVLFFYQENSYSVLSLFLAVYSLILSVMLISFGISFFCSGAESLAVVDKITANNKNMSKFRLLSTFGDKWWQKIIPYQKDTTIFAWPGVKWDEDFNIL